MTQGGSTLVMEEGRLTPELVVELARGSDTPPGVTVLGVVLAFYGTMKEVEWESDGVMMYAMVTWQYWMVVEAMGLGFEMEEVVVISLGMSTSFPIWVVFAFC